MAFKLIVGNPLGMRGIVGWWDASNSSSVITSNNYVSQWNDLSGNGYHLAQAGGDSARPIYDYNFKNGLNAIYTNANRYIYRNGTNIIRNKPYVYLFAANVSENVTPRNISFILPSTSGGYELVINEYVAGHDSHGGMRLKTSATVDTSIPIVSNNYYVSCTALRYSDAILDVYINNATATINPFQTAGNSLDETCGIYVGYIAGLSLIGHHCEYFICTPPTALTASEISFGMNYLNAKWAVY